jgi:hypothetical protein
VRAKDLRQSATFYMSTVLTCNLLYPDAPRGVSVPRGAPMQSIIATVTETFMRFVV